jgi:hypothetical protein
MRSFVYCLLLLFSPNALAQPSPCERLRAVPGAAGYQLRANDPRCEGFYESPVSGGGLEVLSLTLDAVDYKLQENGSIHIIAPDVGSLGMGQLSLHARALTLGTYFRMDALIRSPGSMNWPMSAVLVPAKLSADEIGIVGWVDKQKTRIYVPVSVSDRKPDQQRNTSIIAVLRSSSDIEYLLWRARPDSSAPPSPEWTKLESKGRSFRAGEIIKLPLASGGGINIVEFRGKTSGSNDWLTLQYRMLTP